MRVMPVTELNTSYGIESQLGCLALVPLQRHITTWSGGFRQICAACAVMWTGADGSGCWICEVPGERAVAKETLR